MKHTTGYVNGARRRRIFWQAWSPEEKPRALVVIVHGAAEHSDRYHHVADALVDDGFAAYALDHRGHGRSSGPRALIERLDYAVADVDQLVVQAIEEYPETPVFMLGHSMGGTIALHYAVQHQDRLSGLILSGVLAATEAPASLRAAGRVLSAVTPRLGLIPIDARMVSRNPGVVSAYMSDSFVFHGKLPARTAAQLASAIDDLPKAVPAITVPSLILYGTEDGICPPEGSAMVADRIGSVETTVKAYEGLYHEILNEPERDAVLADICGWIDERLTPRFVMTRDADTPPAEAKREGVAAPRPTTPRDGASSTAGSSSS
jgi:alpha-beta hydrolase superfamily lysophospholipase